MREEDLVKASNFRDRVSTVDKEGHRKWIYAIKPSGKWYNARTIVSYLYLFIFLVIPFIKIGDHPLLMINIVESKFSIFGKMFWPHDMFIFAISMVAFIIFIVLFTIAFGRLLCGWACPQTVFMEFIFRPIEWLFEGSPTQQKKLDQGEWDANKILRKSGKHIVFFLISFLIANAFLSYIIGIDKLLLIISEPISEHTVLLTSLIIFSLLFYVVFAFVRDIVCTTICPYGRLQSVMIDKDTMQIAYDYKRGEPRHKIKKAEVRTEGDCIDCMKCVVVCPTGIDIRNGNQMECVACTACIDACNEVMDAVNLPKGLIRYASENELESGKKLTFNTRMKAYTVVLSILVLIIGFLVFSRDDVDVFISKVKGQLYQENPDGTLSNLYDVKIFNKTKRDATIKLVPENYANASIQGIGTDQLVVKGEQMIDYKLFIKIPKDQIISRSNNLRLGIYLDDKKIRTLDTKFLGPFK
ncbi:MAG: cytochrome c oxidase accessory protein CcoG [Saprospiraceae bacterium]|nr:cytochrome c oxidase accessory protein CcoG [Saprospiraceae bacterium]